MHRREERSTISTRVPCHDEIRIEDSHPPVTACYDQAHLKAFYEMGDAKF